MSLLRQKKSIYQSLRQRRYPDHYYFPVPFFYSLHDFQIKGDWEYHLGMNYQESDEFFQKSEVSDMKWLTLEECIQVIRPYSLEKIEIINKIHKIFDFF